jgi:hypothetical protein
MPDDLATERGFLHCEGRADSLARRSEVPVGIEGVGISPQRAMAAQNVTRDHQGARMIG